MGDIKGESGGVAGSPPISCLFKLRSDGVTLLYFHFLET